MKIYLKFLSSLALAALTFALSTPVQARSLRADAHNARLAIEWFDLQLELAQRTPGFTPPVVSRALAYSGIALYEAVVPGMPGYQSLAGTLEGLSPLPSPIDTLEYDWRLVANSALYEMTHYLYFNASAEDMAKMETLYERWHHELDGEPEIVDRSLMQGRIIANAVLVWSLSDGGYQGQLTNFPARYIPPEGPGMWVQTPRPQGDPLRALQPYWGENRSFVVRRDAQCVLPPPPEYAEEVGSDFYAEAYEVYDTVKHLTAEQNAIALFWADDAGLTMTPPGHSTSILNQVLAQENATLDVAAEAYAKMGMAQADAFILGWYYKYHYNLIRPITYIRDVIDPDWNTSVITDPVVTPPFPEYPSGHSVQSGAAAQVLTDLFGAEYTFTDHTHDERGLEPRTFNSFFAFAEEAAISRLYGGIHFRSAIDLGVENGKCIGTVVSRMQFKSDA
jgi:hypothetical protein